jgi:ubiquinone/menaquinone biosynthesis C-methylase UbiE
LGTDETSEYYAAMSPVYNETAGYNKVTVEPLRIPIKNRYREIIMGRRVLEIACGTGYWTEVIGQAAESVLATDINQSMLSQAVSRCHHLANVKFQIADTFALDGIPVGFNAAFAHWWWSHIPKKRIPEFLQALHRKMENDAVILMVDHLPNYSSSPRMTDSEGNTIEKRTAPDGNKYNVIKNFPSKFELKEVLAGLAQDIQYVEYQKESQWNLIYRVVKK